MDKTLRKIVLLFPAFLILLPLFLIFINSFMEPDEAVLTYDGVLGGKRFSSFVLMPANPSLIPFADLLLYCRSFYTMF